MTRVHLAGMLQREYQMTGKIYYKTHFSHLTLMLNFLINLQIINDNVIKDIIIISSPATSHVLM